MTLERIKKPQIITKLEPAKIQKSSGIGLPTRPFVAATPEQIQRSKAKLEAQKTLLQRKAEEARVQRAAQTVIQEQARVQREADQTVAREEQTRVQRLVESQAKQQAFHSSFIKTPTQRKSLENVKSSSIQASKARGQYQAAIVPEIVQRLVSDQMTVQVQAARAKQTPNALTTRADWFNTELPVLRARHNHPSTPFLDGPNVIKPTDQQAFNLGNTYVAQRMSHGLTPRDAATALMNIQRKADRDLALSGLLSKVNPRQSDYSSIQRLVAAGEHDLEVQRQALLEGDEIQRQAFQLAKEEAHPTTPNSGISEKIKAKVGGGNPLPENVRHQLEAGLNTNLEAVRVHTDSDADKLAKSVNAIAFTTGNDIFFSSGSYNPNTKSGYELVAHEVTHTIQQASGQVSPGVDKDQSLETAAQVKGAELAAKFDPNFKYTKLETVGQTKAPLTSNEATLQRVQAQFSQPVSTPKIGNLESLQRSAPMFGASTLQRSTDGTTIQRSWWNPFDWAKDAANWLGEKFMDGLEWMGEKAAQAFMKVFAIAAKPFGETGKQVLEAIKSIGSSLLNVISNPGQFATNLIEGIKLGFGNFIKNAPKHLTSVLGSFLGGKGLNLTFPTKLEPLPILMAFISTLNLGWDSIKLKIAKQLGPKGGQAITAAEKAPGIVQTISKGLHNSDEFTKEVLPTLKTEAVDGIKSAAQEGLIRAGIGVLLKLIPGAGTVLAIFDTVKVLIERGKDIVSLASNVMGAFSAIASGNLATAAIAVENSLVSGIKVALDFIAKLAKIDTFISRVRDIIGRVTTKISSVVDPIIKKAANFVRPYLDKLTGKPSSSTAVKPGSSTAIPAPSNVKTNSSDPKNQNDTRTLEQKKQAVNDAEKAADSLLLEKDATPESVQAGLPTIKNKFKLNDLQLLKDGNDKYHITASINPTSSTPSRPLKSHKEFKIIKEYPSTLSAGKLTIKYETATGSTFSVTVGGNTPKSPIEIVTGEKLGLKGWKGIAGRGNLNKRADLKDFGLDAAHVIADQFMGTGYTKGNNVIYTSAVFNQQTMADTEREIAVFVTRTKNSNNTVTSFDIKAQIAWESLKDAQDKLVIPDTIIKRLETELVSPSTAHYSDMQGATEAQIKTEITARLEHLKDKIQRCGGLRYSVTIRDVAGKVIDTDDFSTKSSDVWLGLKPHWLK
jgi:Domain of unknown function (DUF4157)